MKTRVSLTIVLLITAVLVLVVLASEGDEVSYLPIVVRPQNTPTPTNTPTSTSTPIPVPTSTPSAPITVFPSDDTSIMQGIPNSNFSDLLFIYTGYHEDGCFDISPGVDANRGLFKFNIPTPPAGATVTSAKLKVYLAAVCWLNDGPRTVNAHRITANWNSALVTWNNQPAFDSSVAGSTSINIHDNVTFGYYTIDVTNLVRGWSNGTIPNQGLMLRSPETSGDNFAWVVFTSKENDDEYDPFLQITYGNSGTPVPTNTPAPPTATSAPPTPTRTPTPQSPPGNCTVCSYDAYNCSDFSTQAQAQACFDYCWDQVGYDVHQLDSDNDGEACESLPLAPLKESGWELVWP